MFRVPRKLDRRSFGDMQIDVAAQVNRTSQKVPTRHQNATATSSIASLNRSLKGPGAISETIRYRAEPSDVEVALGKDRRFDSPQDSGHLRPRIFYKGTKNLAWLDNSNSTETRQLQNELSTSVHNRVLIDFHSPPFCAIGDNPSPAM
jgi:hypothetical protein